jgi:hypothetical protein
MKSRMRISCEEKNVHLNSQISELFKPTAPHFHNVIDY